MHAAAVGAARPADFAKCGRQLSTARCDQKTAAAPAISIDPATSASSIWISLSAGGRIL